MHQPTSSRLVVHVGGFDAMSPERFHARFERELARFQRCWGVEARTRGFEAGPDNAVWTVEAGGADWRVETQHVLLRWDDVIRREHAQSYPRRWARGIAAGADFIIHGALWRYLRHAPRYALFFLFPYLVMLAALIAAAAVGSMAAGLVGAVGGAALAVLLLAGLLVLAGRRAWLDQMLDDWAFAMDHLRRIDPAVERRLELGARLIREAGPGREVLVIGHSLGAALAAEMLARALAADPAGPPVRFLSVGSSILKLAFHARARRLHEAVAALASSPRLIWVEYQAVNDVMNFFRTDPVKVLGLNGRSPVVRKVRFGAMLKPDYYRTIRTNFFRLHCQFVSANDLRAPYDYMMAVAGPFPIEAMAASRDGAMSWIGADGAITPAGRGAAA